MIENIQQTSLLITIVSLLAFNFEKRDSADIPYWYMLITLSSLICGAAISVVTTLIRIWM